jgi:hypothetical protein
MGSIGICKSHKRGGKLRYDFAQRVDGQIFVYYGVTDDGIHGAWRKLVEAEAGGEPEEAMEREPHADAGAPAEFAADYQAEVISEEPLAREPSFEKSEEVSVPSLSESGEPESLEEPEPNYPTIEESPSGLWHRDDDTSTAEPSLGKGEPEEATTPMEGMDWVAEPAPEEPSRSPEEAASPSEPSTGQPAHATEPFRAESLPALQPPHALQEVHPEPPQLPVPKSRAQEWREILDRAIAEARAAQQAAKGHSADVASPAPEVAAPETSGPDSRTEQAAPNTEGEQSPKEGESSDADRRPIIPE